jgi:hypothetical protein
MRTLPGVFTFGKRLWFFGLEKDSCKSGILANATGQERRSDSSHTLEAALSLSQKTPSQRWASVPKCLHASPELRWTGALRIPLMATNLYTAL